MKDQILKTAELLMSVNKTTSTLEVKTALRTLFPNGVYTQDVVSEIMSELYEEQNWYRELNNCHYYSYSLKQTNTLDEDRIANFEKEMLQIDFVSNRRSHIYDIISEILSDDLEIYEDFNENSKINEDLDLNKREKTKFIEFLLETYEEKWFRSLSPIENANTIKDIVDYIYTSLYDSHDDAKNAIFNDMWCFMNYNNNDNIHLYYELWDEDDIVDMLAYINKKHNLSLNIVDFDIDKCNNYNDLLCKLTCTE